MRWSVVALLFQGCMVNCGPGPDPLPPTVAGPVSVFQGTVAEGWTLDAYLNTKGNVFFVGLLNQAVQPVNDVLSHLAADIGRVMLQPGAGQGSSGVAQPTSYDADQAVWNRMGGKLTLGLHAPYPWQLADSAGNLQAWSQPPAISVDLAVEAQSHSDITLHGSLTAQQSDTSNQRVIEAHHVDGDRDLAFASRSTETGFDDEFETYADVSGGSAKERVAVKLRWRSDLAGRADAVISEGDLGATPVTATECWMQQGSQLVVVYYQDSAALRPTQGSDTACAVTRVMP